MKELIQKIRKSRCTELELKLLETYPEFVIPSDTDKLIYYKDKIIFAYLNVNNTLFTNYYTINILGPVDKYDLLRVIKKHNLFPQLEIDDIFTVILK